MERKWMRVGSIAWQMCRDRVLIRPTPEPDHVLHKGLVWLPMEQARREFRFMSGIVVLVGPGRLDDDQQVYPMSVQVGDTVSWGNEMGVPVRVDGIDYVFIREEDMVAIGDLTNGGRP